MTNLAGGQEADRLAKPTASGLVSQRSDKFHHIEALSPRYHKETVSVPRIWIARSKIKMMFNK